MESSALAVNAVVQGTAADLLKLALAELSRQLPEGCQLLLTIHDSVLLQAPASNAQEVARQASRIMEECARDFAVPLKVSAACGAMWASCR